jgi:glycine cleavage system transcriptional repressor
MTKRYIITLMAANRVGILAAVTTSLAELGGDIQEVSQTVMQRFFTIIMAAEFPEGSDRAVIVDHIRGVCRPFGVEVSLKDPDTELLQDLPPEGVERYFLTAEGQDKPGMVRQISARLAQEGIDITDVFARRADEGQTFVMVMELAVPPGVDALALQRELEQLGSAVGLIASLQHEDIFSATNDPRPVRVAQRLRRAESAAKPA